MKINKKLLILILAGLTFVQSYSQEEISEVAILALPSLPAEEGVDNSLGYAGMLGGEHNGVVIAAGGANFPNGLPWEGGEKVWSKSIYFLENNKWRLSSKELPIPLAYSSSVNTENGIVCIGGNNESHTSDKVLLLSYNSTKKEVEISEYPTLPEPLAYAAAVIFEGYVYVVGGKNSTNSTNSFYRLRLKDNESWEKLSDFPGLPRAVHCAAVQETSTNKKLFVIGGRNQVAGRSQTFILIICLTILKNKYGKMKVNSKLMEIQEL